MALKLDLIRRLWNSSTVTSWANMAAQSTRLFLVTPLLLARFDAVEVASWLLFSSVLLFGNLVTDQVASLLVRMLALAAGGATNLAPSRHDRAERTNGPNFDLLRRIYGCIGYANLAMMVITVVIAGILGVLALQKLLADYAHSDSVWLAFVIMLSGEAIRVGCQRFSIVLRGLNHVALTNRWDALFALFSSATGAACLQAGGGIVALAIAVQGFRILGIARLWIFFRRFVDLRIRGGTQYSLDSQVAGWAWDPLWRGIVRHASNKGSIQLAGIALARHGSPQEVASYLITFRLMDTVTKVSLAPLKSKVPKFARLLGEQNLTGLRQQLRAATMLSQALQITFYISLAATGSQLLGIIGSEVPFMPLPEFLIFAALAILSRFLDQSLLVSMLGNQVICTKRSIAATLISWAGASILVKNWGVYGALFVAYVPLIVILNVSPFKHAATIIDVDPVAYFKRIYGGPWLVFVIAALILLVYRSYI